MKEIGTGLALWKPQLAQLALRKSPPQEVAEHEEGAARELTLRVLSEIVGPSSQKRLRVRLWDGSYWPDNAPPTNAPTSIAATLVLNHPGALREMLLANTELALAEAYLHGDIDVEGDLEAAFELVDVIANRTGGWSRELSIAHWLKKLPPRADGKESCRSANLRELRDSPERDRAAFQFHYDLSNDFFGLWLDSAKAYSCAYFQTEAAGLEKAQAHKMDTICRKLGLRPGDRLMDVGCGWGALIMHAALYYGVRATGITVSARQAECAQHRIDALGLRNCVEVRLQDYREVKGNQEYDAVVNIGMLGHVGRRNLPSYFGVMNRILKPGGLFLTEAIGTGAVPLIQPAQYEDSFMDKYVFPDAVLVSAAETIQEALAEGLEVRDLENLRPHYALTLRHWVGRLEARHKEALNHVSESVYRSWRLYLAGSAHRFKTGQLAGYQTVFVKSQPSGQGTVPLNRAQWYQDEYDLRASGLRTSRK